ncbi:hypothetical protein [Longispora urticae]
MNDDFYTARPFEFFASRIASLLASSRVPAACADEDLGSDFAAVLGFADASEVLRIGDSARAEQLAIDSLAVRHHAAEALVRLYHALTIGVRSGGAAPPCLWASIADGPRMTSHLVEAAMARLASDAGREEFPGLVLRPGWQDSDSPPAELMTQAQLMVEWLCHGLQLLDRDDIDVNAAHNKLKHGLAVRSRDDLRVTFVEGPLNPDGTVPLSALNAEGAIDLIDSISLDCLSRPRTVNGRKQGLEVTTLRLKPATVLAEAWMLALTYGAMFHVAAATHFHSREVQISPYPAVPLEPTPDQMLRNSVIGFRHPLTTPPSGGQIDRGSGFAFHEGFVPMNIDHAARRTTLVADN